MPGSGMSVPVAMCAGKKVQLAHIIETKLLCCKYWIWGVLGDLLCICVTGQNVVYTCLQNWI